MSGETQVKAALCHNFPAELLLLLQCADQQPDTQQQDRIRQAAARDIDWTVFLSLAERHRVVPHAYLALSRSAIDLVPEPTMDDLGRRFQENTKKNLRAAGELARICHAMNEAEIPLMCLKGPALAIQMYGGLGRRQFKDLDLLVPTEQAVEAARVLNQLGYYECEGTVALSSLSPSQQKRLKTFHKECKFAKKKGPCSIVELHWKLADHDMLTVSPKRLWSDDHNVSLAGTRFHVLPPLEQVIYLAWHGSGHRWKRLSWVFDLSQALQRFPELDWQVLERTAFQMGVQRYVALGLTMSRQLLGTRIPKSVFSKIDVRRAADQVRHAMLVDSQYYEKKPFAFMIWTWQMWPKMRFSAPAIFHKLAPEKSQIHLFAPFAYLKRLLQLEKRTRRLLLSRLR